MDPLLEKINALVSQYYQEKHASRPFNPGETGIPNSGKVFDDQELKLMVEAVLDGWWTEGRFTAEFERQLAAYVGTTFCATVNSGSSANLVAFSALTSPLLSHRRLMPGDEVITVAAGFPTTVNPIIQNNCVPVFVDISLETLGAVSAQLEAAITPKTKAIMIAHPLGNPIDLATVQALCKKHNLWFVEDNCDGLGSLYQGQRTGSFGDISTLSFYPAHQITTAEGGAVLTKHPLLKKIILSVRDWGRDCWCPTGCENTCGIRFQWKRGTLPAGYDHKFIYSHVGYNLKMTDVQAACGLAQLKKLPNFVQKRKDNFVRLQNALAPLSRYFSFIKATPGSEPSWFGFPLLINENSPFTRQELLVHLAEKKIGTRLLFAGNLTRQPYFINYHPAHRVAFPLTNTDRVMNDLLWIGAYPAINEERIQYIADTLATFVEQKMPVPA